MRPTLDIEQDVLQAAKEMAAREGTTAGRVISRLARKGLRPEHGRAGMTVRNGVPVFPARRDEVVTMDRVQTLMDEEGV
jgi:hypothetical protein